MSFRFRAAAPADVEAITDVYLASWRAGYEELLPHDTLEKQAAVRGRYDWLEAIESPSTAVILGINSGHVVGVVEAREELPEAERDLPEITMLYVAPTLWGTPLATQLLAAGCSWIRQRGHHVARLRVVENQERARRFYEREGWTVDPNLPPASNGLFRLLYYWRALGQGSSMKVRRRTATDLDACERLARIVHERDG